MDVGIARTPTLADSGHLVADGSGLGTGQRLVANGRWFMANRQRLLVHRKHLPGIQRLVTNAQRLAGNRPHWGCLRTDPNNAVSMKSIAVVHFQSFHYFRIEYWRHTASLLAVTSLPPDTQCQAVEAGQAAGSLCSSPSHAAHNISVAMDGPEHVNRSTDGEMWVGLRRSSVPSTSRHPHVSTCAGPVR